MEQLTEEISSEIGPKWVQLFSRLKVNYKERYRLCAQYKVEKDRPKHEQEINCARDTIRLWQKNVGEIPEQEVMTELLTALRKVKGFEERAKELSESYGITLVDTLPAATAATSSLSTTATTSHTTSFPSSNGSSVATIHTDSTSRHTVTESTTLTPSSSPSLHTSPNSVASSQETLSDVSSSHSQSTTQEHKLPRPSTEGPTKSSLHSEDITHLLQTPVNMSLTSHKYAILDICQRLPAGILPYLAQKLDISQETVREISANFPMTEETYYQVLKHWLCAGNRQRTFVELQCALDECQQHTLLEFIVRRLQSTGLTLR